MKNQVFVSYEHNSKPIADSIVAAFEKDMIRCWYAPRDVIGDYATSIVDAIDSCCVFVLILNGESSKSPHVLNEVEMAYKRNIESANAITIVPFRVSNDELSRAMEYYVKRMHWIDATSTTLAKAIDDLKVKVKKALGVSDDDEPKQERTDNKYFSIADAKEIKRLKIQSSLLKRFDGEVFGADLDDISSMKVLDVGCNMGDGFYERFSGRDNLSLAIGLDCDKEAIDSATKRYGSDRFKFYCLDVESRSFEDDLEGICANANIDKFDVIYASMLLLHLKQPAAVLRKLRHFLASGGRLIIRDIDDGYNVAYPDQNGIFKNAVKICADSKYSGYRASGREIFRMLKDAGYKDIKLENLGLSTVGLSYDEREALFNTYFGFLPGDFKRLVNEGENAEHYAEQLKWLDDNYDKLEEEFMKEDFFFTLGFMLYTARK